MKVSSLSPILIESWGSKSYLPPLSFKFYVARSVGPSHDTEDDAARTYRMCEFLLCVGSYGATKEEFLSLAWTPYRMRWNLHLRRWRHVSGPILGIKARGHQGKSYE